MTNEDIEIYGLLGALKIVMMTTINSQATVICGMNADAMRSLLDDQRDIALGFAPLAFSGDNKELLVAKAREHIAAMFDGIGTNWSPDRRPHLKIVE